MDSSRAAKARGNGARSSDARWFLAGPENHLAAAAIGELLNSGGRAMGPLVLHGPPGTGKSHLARGLADAWRRQPVGPVGQVGPVGTGPVEVGPVGLELGAGAQACVICLPASELSDGFSDAIERRKVSAWRSWLRGADLLVLENLGGLGAKAAVQVELLHTLDALAERGSQVVVTSRLPPSQMKSLLGGLQSRLSEGLQVPMVLPGPLARLAIIRQLSGGLAVGLASSAARALADGLNVPAPELWGVLVYLQTVCLQAGTAAEPPGGQGAGRCEIDGPLVRRYLMERTEGRRPTLQSIAQHTARHFALPLRELKGASRRRGLVLARDVAMYLCRQLTGKSLASIGQYFGGRDHTTVQHGCRKIENLQRSDPLTRQAVACLRQVLAAG